MSQQALANFRQKVNESPELQAALRHHMHPFDLFTVVKIGKENGYDFTSADAKEMFDKATASGDDRELSDFELEMVAGGNAGSAAGPTSDDGK